MKVCARRFNTYLALALAVGLLSACQTASHKSRNEIPAALRVYLETDPDGTSMSKSVTVFRAHPLDFTIATTPVLTEANIVDAKVIPAQEGYAIQIQFDESGTWTLELYSASNLGKHLVIFGQWGKKASDGRWLAAPIITQRIGDGKLVFTADASREEADQLVLGLNAAIKQIHKGDLK
jgi:preprotein translocase subunit SecD